MHRDLMLPWFSQGLIGTLFIRANVWWSRYRKGSRLGQYPVLEVLAITVINGIIAYPNPYTRMSSTRLIYLLFSQCGVANTDDLWYVTVFEPFSLVAYDHCMINSVFCI